MVKRTPPKKNKKTSKTPRGNARRGEQPQTKQRSIGQQLVETQPRPLDLEPDGSIQQQGSRYEAIAIMGSSSEDESMSIEPNSPVVNRRPGLRNKPPIDYSRLDETNNPSAAEESEDSDYHLPSDPEDDLKAKALDTVSPVRGNELRQLDEDTRTYNRLIADGHTDLNDIARALQYNMDECVEFEPESNSDRSLSSSTENESTPRATYRDAAQMEEDSSYHNRPPDPNRTLRYNLRVIIPGNPEPMKLLLTSIRTTLDIIQSASSKKIGIGPWDPDKGGQVIRKPRDLMDGENGPAAKKFVQKYFDLWARVTPNKPYTAFLKIRFVTDVPPNELKIPLAELGMVLEDDISFCKNKESEPIAYLSRNPIPCQATKVSCIGWLFGSTKTMRDDTLCKALRDELSIPDEVALGISWRTIKNAQKKNPAWINDNPPPQALTIEIDETYAPIYTPAMAALWKKRSRARILGRQYRLIPCFTSPKMASADDFTRAQVAEMANKQGWFLTQHVSRLTVNKFVAALDKPIPDPANPTKTWTLRRYIMNKAPVGFPLQRLFISADQSWDGDGAVFMTSKLHFEEAEHVLNNMIPECLHNFGAPAADWFTPTGIKIYKDTIFDPTSGKTISVNNDLEGLVEENFLGMGTAWRDTPENPALTPTAREGDGHTTNVNLPTTLPGITVNDLITQRRNNPARSDLSIQSFGDRIFERDHDGDTVHTKGAPPTNTTTVEVDLTGMELQSPSSSICARAFSRD